MSYLDGQAASRPEKEARLHSPGPGWPTGATSESSSRSALPRCRRMRSARCMTLATADDFTSGVQPAGSTRRSNGTVSGRANRARLRASRASDAAPCTASRRAGGCSAGRSGSPRSLRKMRRSPASHSADSTASGRPCARSASDGGKLAGKANAIRPRIRYSRTRSTASRAGPERSTSSYSCRGASNGRTSAGLVQLTAGCDCQADRLVVVAVGWRADDTGSILMAESVIGDPTESSVWESLAGRLSMLPLPAAVVGIDAGYSTGSVQAACALRRRWVPTVGRAGAGPIARPLGPSGIAVVKTDAANAEWHALAKSGRLELPMFMDRAGLREMFCSEALAVDRGRVCWRPVPRQRGQPLAGLGSAVRVGSSVQPADSPERAHLRGRRTARGLMKISGIRPTPFRNRPGPTSFGSVDGQGEGAPSSCEGRAR